MLGSLVMFYTKQWKKKSYWGKSLLKKVLQEHTERKFYSERI